MSMTRRKQWAFAVLVALLIAVNRVVADAFATPHIRWWFTPVVAATSSLVTSAAWIYRGLLAQKRTAR